MADETFQFTLWVGGRFIRDKLIEYVDGYSIEWLYDPDKLSYFEILHLVQDMNYSNIEKLHYLMPGNNFENGLRVIEDDTSVQEMIGFWEKHFGTGEIFIEHSKDMSVGIGNGLAKGLMNVEEDEGAAMLIEDDDELVEVPWLSNNEEEELQVARGKIRTFKGDNAYGVARLVEIPSEINVEVEQKRRRKEAIAIHCEDNVELEIECFDSSGSNWSFVTSDEEELEVEEATRRKSTDVQYDETAEIPHFALNMVFDGPKQFKETINKYASTRRVNIDFIKNDKVRVRAKCKAKNCDWLIYAARDNKTDLFLVKTFKDEHTCSWSFQVRRFTSTYMAKHYLSLWRAAPSMKLQEFKRIVREQMSLDVTISQCRRTREKVIAKLNGMYSYEFSRLWSYCEEILHRNPRNTVKVKFLRESPNSRPIFQ